MRIPIFYRIWVSDSELIRSMKEGNLPETEALDLYRKYMGSQKKYLKRITIFALIFLIGACAGLFGESFLPNEAYVFIPLLVAIFVGVFGAISGFNKYSVSGEYVRALQEGYPKMVQRELA